MRRQLRRHLACNVNDGIIAGKDAHEVPTTTSLPCWSFAQFVIPSKRLVPKPWHAP